MDALRLREVSDQKFISRFYESLLEKGTKMSSKNLFVINSIWGFRTIWCRRLGANTILLLVHIKPLLLKVLNNIFWRRINRDRNSGKIIWVGKNFTIIDPNPYHSILVTGRSRRFFDFCAKLGSRRIDGPKFGFHAESVTPNWWAPEFWIKPDKVLRYL